MSTWRYQAFRHIADTGEPFFAIHEYYNLHDGREAWTVRSVPLEANTPEELRAALHKMIADLDRYGVRDFEPDSPAEGATT